MGDSAVMGGGGGGGPGGAGGAFANGGGAGAGASFSASRATASATTFAKVCASSMLARSEAPAAPCHRCLTDQLIRSGGPVNAKDGVFAWQALMTAALEGHADVAQALVANRADVHAKDSQGHERGAHLAGHRVLRHCQAVCSLR